MTVLTTRVLSTRENFGGEKLANRELFTKIFFANLHRYTKNLFTLCTDYSLFTKFFAFTLYCLPKFSPAKCFLCMVFALKIYL